MALVNYLFKTNVMTGWYYQLVAFMEMIILVENTRSTTMMGGTV